MVNGPAVAGGLTLALLCDIRIASDTAIIGDTSGTAGLLPDEGGAWLFPRAMGLDRALRMVFGLGGSVWTSDEQRGIGVARRVHTGSIGVNNYALDICSPFGGVKASGLGRELGPEGLASYQQTKSIFLPPAAEPKSADQA